MYQHNPSVYPVLVQGSQTLLSTPWTSHSPAGPVQCLPQREDTGLGQCRHSLPQQLAPSTSCSLGHIFPAPVPGAETPDAAVGGNWVPVAGTRTPAGCRAYTPLVWLQSLAPNALTPVLSSWYLVLAAFTHVGQRVRQPTYSVLNKIGQTAVIRNRTDSDKCTDQPHSTYYQPFCPFPFCSSLIPFPFCCTSPHQLASLHHTLQYPGPSDFILINCKLQVCLLFFDSSSVSVIGKAFFLVFVPLGLSVMFMSLYVYCFSFLLFITSDKVLHQIILHK